MTDPLSFLGIKSAHAIAGAMGGFAFAALFAKTVRDWIVYVCIGSYAGPYFGPGVFDELVHRGIIFNSEKMELFVVSLLGVIGTLLLKGVVRLARRWSENPNLPGAEK